MKKYEVKVLGGYAPLYEGDNLKTAENVRARWAMKVGMLGVNVILVDLTTGEVLAGI